MFISIFCIGLLALVLLIAMRQDLDRLRREVEHLNARLKRLESADRDGACGDGVGEPVAQTASAAAAPPPAPPHRPQSLQPQPAVAARRFALDLEKVIGGQWLTWLGIVAIFLGTAFFLAIDLGPSPLAGLPQVLVAVAMAVLFLTLGRRLRGGVHGFLGLGLQGGGIALFYLVAYGLFGFHELVAVQIVIPALLLVAVVGALFALAANSLTIAGLTLLGALATPLVLVRETGWGLVLLPYLVAVNLGAVLVGRRRGWAGLPLGAFVGTFVLVTAWWGDNFGVDQRGALLGAMTVIWILFGLIPWLGRLQPGFWGLARTLLVAANGACYAGVFCAALAPEMVAWRGAALFGIAVAYLAASIAGGCTRRADPALVANFYTGAALLIVAVPVQFHGVSMGLVWALIGTLLLLMGWRERDAHHRLAALAGLGAAALRLLLIGVVAGAAGAGVDPLFLNPGFLSDVAVLAMFMVARRIYRALGDELTPREKPMVDLIHPVVALLGWWVFTGEVARWSLAGSNLTDYLVSLPLAWAAYGLTAHHLGRRHRLYWLRCIALANLGLAAVSSIILQASQVGGADERWRPVLNAGGLAGALTIAGLLIIHRGYGREHPWLRPGERLLAIPLLLVAHGLMLTLGSLEIAGWFRQEGDAVGLRAAWATLVSISIFWTLYGGALIWSGFLVRLRPLRLAGMSLLALVVLKVFLVDMQALSAGYRIVSFVVVGLLLLVISLMYQRERRAGERSADETTR